MPLATLQYQDFNISFLANPITKDLVKVTNASAIVQSIVNLVQYNHYEFAFHPEIGGNVRKLLFEPADGITASLLSKEIQDVITNFEPRVTLIGVYVQETQDGNGFNITIEFSINTQTETITVNFFLERIR